MSSTYATASRGVLGAVLLGFLTVLAFPADLPQLFGPEGFGWASWCYAFGVPVLALALWTGSARRIRLVWPAVAYLAWIAATAAFSVNIGATLLEAARLLGIVLAAFAAAWLVQTSGRQHTLALAWLMALLFVVQVVAFMNHVEYGLAERITVYVLPAGWGGYPELGPLVSVQFAICLATLVTARSWAARLAAVSLAGVSVLQAIFLYSRLTWVALAVVFVVMLPLAGLRRRALAPLALAGVLLAVVVGGAVVLNPTFRQLFGAAVTGEFGGAGVVDGVTLNVANLDARSRLWVRTSQMISDHWATGVGLGNFRDVFEGTYHPEVNDDGRRGVHAHNAFLQQAAELGVVGGLAYAGLWAFAFVWAFTASRSHHGLVHLAIAGCVVALLVHSLGDYLSFTLDGPRGRLTFVAWLALAMASIRPSRPALASREAAPTAAMPAPA